MERDGGRVLGAARVARAGAVPLHAAAARRAARRRTDRRRLEEDLPPAQEVSRLRRVKRVTPSIEHKYFCTNFTFCPNVS